ncbi:ribosome recycling factor [Proteiniborus ethanoligenes]|uniref:Ribosome-recycling factor n=1 Tax=Proteiniborus ethanoligenes TaxID=415015 RepID=A0A1H3N5P5_9FIRM|nr:ribosome recycling factor [Proteiniborus ethanoligenes]TAH63255.1 MAG: ribosome recycling factor [Gottschalkiaceae bacterium]SDY84192.1 ribosome recycling factor [Proteiniborus ethanoligenes]
MYLDVHKQAEEKMKKTIKAFKEDLNSIRAGRANPTLLDRITIDYYGTQTPLNQISNISAPEPRLLVIQPWDANVISQIEKSILKSDLGLNPSNDGKLIRLAIPQLTEERRKELIKVVKKNSENAKVAIRNGRREANEQIKKMQKASELTEDEQKQAEEQMQKITDKYIEEIDSILVQKEKELLEV